LIVRTVGTLGNAGLLEATSTGTLTLLGDDVVNASTGIVDAATGGRLDLGDSTVSGGLVESTGTGILRTTDKGSILDGTSSTVTVAGVLHVNSGTNLTIQGAIDNTGQIRVSSTFDRPDLTDLIVGPSGATLSGGGSVVMTPLSENRIYGVSGTATLTNVDNKISGGGLLGNGAMTLINDADGFIHGSTAAGLVIDTGTNAITNAGEIDSSGTGGVTVDSAIDNSGVLNASGGNLTVKGAVTGSGDAKVHSATLDFISTFSQNVDFTGKSGVLELGHSVSYGGTIRGFSKTGGTSLDLSDIAFGSNTKASYAGTARQGVLTVTDGTETANITLVGDYLNTVFTPTTDGSGGTIVTDSVPVAPGHALVAAMAGLGGSSATTSTAESHQAAHMALLAAPAARFA